jgi:hypothetical protein
MRATWERWEMHPEFGGGEPEGITRKRRWEDNIKMDIREMVWTGCIWLRIGSSGRHM